MAGNSYRGPAQTAIQRASGVTGTDTVLMFGTARRESGYNPTAKATTSSAAGLYQFLDQTWLATLKRHGARHGYARYSGMIQRTADGRYTVANAPGRKAVMALRLDPHAAALMAGELTSDHADFLQARIGRRPTGGELYAAHFLGPQGAAMLIGACMRNPGQSAAALFPAAAGANKPIFYRQGRPATVREVYENLTRPTTTKPPKSLVPANADQGFARYAALRQMQRVAVQRAPAPPARKPADGGGLLALRGPFGSSRTRAAGR